MHFKDCCSIFLGRIMLPFIWFDSTLCYSFLLLTIFYANVICPGKCSMLVKTKAQENTACPLTAHTETPVRYSLPSTTFSFQNKLKC